MFMTNDYIDISILLYLEKKVTNVNLDKREQ